MNKFVQTRFHNLMYFTQNLPKLYGRQQFPNCQRREECKQKHRALPSTERTANKTFLAPLATLGSDLKYSKGWMAKKLMTYF